MSKYLNLEQFPKNIEQNLNSLSKKTMRKKIMSKINMSNTNLSKISLKTVKSYVEPLICKFPKFWMYHNDTPSTIDTLHPTTPSLMPPIVEKLSLVVLSKISVVISGLRHFLFHNFISCHTKI